MPRTTRMFIVRVIHIQTLILEVQKHRSEAHVQSP